MSDEQSRKVNEILSDLGIRVSFESKKVYELIKSQTKRTDKPIEEEKGVVYRMVCKKCKEKGLKKCYIGETGRELGVRVKEHMYRNKDINKVTDVFWHGFDEYGEIKRDNWEVEIIAREKDEFRRRYLEAKEIVNNGGNFNKSSGIIIF